MIYTALGVDWDIDRNLYRDTITGLQAQVYFNSYTKEMIIAFRGTEGLDDIIIGDVPIATGNDAINFQMMEARRFVNEILNHPKYNTYRKVITGHSLGGYLALDSGAIFKVPTVTFNAPGKNYFLNINVATVFDPVKSIVNYFRNKLDPIHQKQVANDLSGNYDQIIRNYNYRHDAIGELGFHPGEKYYVDEQGKVYKNVHEKDHFKNNILKAELNIEETHGISYFTGVDEDGKPVETSVSYDKDGNIVSR